MASGVKRYLVTTPDPEARQDFHLRVGFVGNVIDQRSDTVFYTVMGENAEGFLEAAREVGVTVEELHGGGESETYELLIGEAGSGWAS